MFKLHRHKSDKLGDKFNFNFSFQALQVPKGWDKLAVSIVSMETGKTICKSGKASVRSGNCRWTETLSESILITQRESLKENEECLFKFVVAMRSGILGEATINLVKYTSSTASTPVTFPLKKCNHGTILQVKIQCLTPKPKPRDELWKDTNSQTKDQNDDNDDLENKSDVSDSAFTRSVGSLSSNHLDSTSHPEEPFSRETSFSASGSHHSFDSAEGSFSQENCSPRNNLSEFTNNLIGRQDSSGSQNGSPYGSFSTDPSRSSHLSFISKVAESGSHLQNQREDLGQISHADITSPSQNADSSNDLLEASEVTIQEIRAEARMWEQNSIKLMGDLEKLQKELTDQTKHQTSLERDLSASQKHCDGLKQEIKQLNNTLEESVLKQIGSGSLKFQENDTDSTLKELQDEIKFQKRSNSNLALQLKQTQESNIELVSILQELEESIEKQKLEIANLSILKSESENVGKYGYRHEDCQEITPSMQVSNKKKKNVSWDSDQDSSGGKYPTQGLCGDFEPEDKRNLEIELLKLHGSQKNFESTIQSLEKSLWEKNREIEIERGLKTEAVMHCEVEWKDKLAAKEDQIISLEAKLSKAFITQGLKEMDYEDRGDCDLNKEIEALTLKVQELERDCNELTDENLQLLLELKESRKDLMTSGDSFDFSKNECPENITPFTSESELSKQKSHIYDVDDELKKKQILIEEVSTDHIKSQFTDLENKCADLELQLLDFKDKTSQLDAELSKCHSRAEEKEVEIVALQQQLECYQVKETASKEHFVADCTEFKISNSHVAAQMSTIFSKLHEQLQLFVANINKQQSTPYLPPNTDRKYGSGNSENLESTYLITQKEQAESVLKSFVQLKKLFEGGTLPSLEGANMRMINTNAVENKLQHSTSTENMLCTSSEVLKNLQTDPNKKLLEKTSDRDKLKDGSLEKEEELALTHSQRDLETQISNIREEKIQLEEHVTIMLGEGNITSRCLDDLRNDMMMMNGNINSQVSSNEILVKKSLEVESSHHELEVHLSELEDENIQLSERVCAMEAQLRYLTDERESCRFKLHNSESHAIHLQDEIRRLETELEAQNADMIQKVQNMQNRWLEAQEECDYLKTANPKLQAVAENLIEECSFLQRSNVELRKHNMELHEQSIFLEAELRDSKNSVSHMLKEVEVLEDKFSSMLVEVSLKEKVLSSELDALLLENKMHKENRVLEESQLNQMYLEKEAEVENLRREVKHLSKQIYATEEEKQRTASEAVLEVSHLRVDKATLQASLEEVQGKLRLSESTHDILLNESERKEQWLNREFAASKQKEEVLMTNHEKILGLLEEVKSNEDNLKRTARKFELKLKASEYEKLQLAEELSSLKVQSQNNVLLQDEILALKRSLSEANFENERLKASLQILSADYEELKAQRISLSQKNSSMQLSLSELEDCGRLKVALEEKVLRLEGDLTAREALRSQEAELRNEIARVRRENIKFQRTIKYLEDEKEECLKRVHVLEEELRQKIGESRDQGESLDRSHHPHSESKAINSIHDELKISMEENTDVKISKKPSFEIEQFELPNNLDEQRINRDQRQVNMDNNHYSNSGNPQEIDPLSRIQFLENALAEALEANEMYKSQLKSLLSKETNIHSDDTEKNEESEHKGSSIETELRELRHSYSCISLKYAEAESEREELSMKLKAVNSAKELVFIN